MQLNNRQVTQIMTTTMMDRKKTTDQFNYW